MIGQVFGDYRVLEKRGEGGMGMFFKAVDQRLDRIVGLKTLRAELLADASLLDRLQTEAKSLARLDHQNIARLLHYMVIGGQHFIVMEFVDGLDLAETIRKSGLLPIDRLASIIGQVCAAMSYAHAKGVVHRDLKPSNILITPEGQVKVTDFGIAKILGTSSQTQTGTAAGSLPYMAPEQIRASEVDARTDIYQLGIMLFELTAGRRPFVSDNEYDMMTMQLETPPPAPSTINPRVPPAADSVIQKALAKSPPDRFQTADELNVALQAALAGAGSDPPTSISASATVVGRSAADMDKTVMPQRVAIPVPAGKRTASPPPRPAFPSSGGEEPKARPKPWLWAIAATFALAAVVTYFLWPNEGTPPKDVPGPTDTTAVVQPPKVEMVPVSLQAQIPAGAPRDRVRTVTLAIVHPDSGTSVDTVDVVGGQIQTDFTVAPADSIRLIVRGYDNASKELFKGDVVRNAPAGSRLFIDVPLTSLVTADTASPREVVQPKINPPPAEVTNLVINVEPFTMREKIEEVLLDGRPVSGEFPLKQRVSPGRHKIRWRIGGSRWTDTVTVGQQGTPVEKHIFAGSGVGRLTVAARLPSDAGFADIWLDGVSTGQGTPWRIDNVPAGSHEVEVKHEKYVMRNGPQIIDLQPHEDKRVEFEMSPR